MVKCQSKNNCRINKQLVSVQMFLSGQGSLGLWGLALQDRGAQPGQIYPGFAFIGQATTSLLTELRNTIILKEKISDKKLILKINYTMHKAMQSIYT